MSNVKGQFGFTLVETLIYIAIISGIMLAFVTFSISISDSKNKAYVVTEVQENARIALEIISQKIRSAVEVNTGFSIFGVDPGVLSLAMDEPDKNPTILDLSADNGLLRIKEGVNNPVIITNSKVRVANLVFTNLTSPNTDRENIRVEITITYNSNSSDVEYNYSYSLQTAISLRQ